MSDLLTRVWRVIKGDKSLRKNKSELLREGCRAFLKNCFMSVRTIFLMILFSTTIVSNLIIIIIIGVRTGPSKRHWQRRTVLANTGSCCYRSTAGRGSSLLMRYVRRHSGLPPRTKGKQRWFCAHCYFHVEQKEVERLCSLRKAYYTIKALTLRRENWPKARIDHSKAVVHRQLRWNKEARRLFWISGLSLFCIFVLKWVKSFQVWVVGQ